MGEDIYASTFKASNCFIELINNGIASIPCPLTNQRWEELYILFDKFIRSLSSDEKNSFNLEAKKWQETSGLSLFYGGYFSPYYRDTTKLEGKDNKQIFQICLPYFQYLDSTNSVLLQNESFKRLLECSIATMMVCYQSLIPLVERFKTYDSTLYNRLIPSASLPPIALRLIRYENDALLATNPHVDKRALTLLLNSNSDPENDKVILAKDINKENLSLNDFGSINRVKNQSLLFFGAAPREAGFQNYKPMPHAVSPFKEPVRHSAVFFWLLPDHDMSSFDTTVKVYDNSGLMRTMKKKIRNRHIS